MRGTITSALAAVAMAATCLGTAAAEPMVFSGGGPIARVVAGSLQTTGTAVVGDFVRFAFTFDLAAATQVGTGGAGLTYALPISDVDVALGRYQFLPAGTRASLTISQGFSFFGGSSTEPSRAFTFSIGGSAGADAPFDLGNGARSDRFTITSIYRDIDPSRPVSLADVIDPLGVPLRSINYSGSTGPSGSSASLQGFYSGGFSPAAAAVPEPASWAMMLAGFGAAGFVLRRRQRRVLAAA